MQAKNQDLPISARIQPKRFAKIIINHFPDGHIGINSKLSGITDEGIHLIITPLLSQCCPIGLILNYGRAQNTQKVTLDQPYSSPDQWDWFN